MDVLDDVGFNPEPAFVVVEQHQCNARRCGARAYLWAEVKGAELAYCRHHGNEYFDGLVMAGRIKLDLRDTVLRKPVKGDDD